MKKALNSTYAQQDPNAICGSHDSRRLSCIMLGLDFHAGRECVR
jgi:hypothetical protein